MPPALALALYWPILLPGYRLDGGLANEILMVNGMRSAFNRALLSGELPFWNEWVAGGKPFLIFGAFPLTFTTPFELVFGPEVSQTLYKAELVIVALIGASLFLSLGRRLALRPLSAALAFFTCYLMGQMPYHMGLVQSANFFLWGAAAVVSALLYFATEDRRLVALFLAFAFLSALGGRPDVYAIFPLFMGGMVVARLLERLVVDPRRWRESLGDAVFNMLAFSVLPLAFYVWQLPLILSLAKTAGARVWGSSATFAEALDYFATAIHISYGGRIVVSWMILVCAAKLTFLMAGQRRSGAQPGALKRAAQIFAIVALILAAASVASPVPWPSIQICLVGVAAIVFRAACRKFAGDGLLTERAGFWRSIEAQLTISLGWVWPVAIAGVNAALVEDAPATREVVEPFFVLKAAFLFCVLYSLTLVAEGGEALLPRMARYLALCVGVGWFFRDFVSLPLYDFANVIWPVQRDMFWYVPALAVMFAIGWDTAITDIRMATAGWARDFLRIKAAGAAAAGLLLVAVAYQVLSLYYVPAGQRHPSEVWRHFTEWDRGFSDQRWVQRAELYQESLRNCGPDARVLVEPLPEIGFPGAEAIQRIRNAWGYDFVNDHYRALAEAGFSWPLGDRPRAPQYPRLYHYNFMAGRVYHLFKERFTDIDRAQQIYDRFQMLAIGSRLDSFYLQIMGVCSLLLHRAPKNLEPFALRPSPWGDSHAYVARLPRQPRRFALLLSESPHDERLKDKLKSEDRASLQALYARLRFEGDELSRDGLEIIRVGFGANFAKLRVKTDQAGVLVQFDAWDPNWVATVNGENVPVDRAFVAMRAVAIPKGASEVVLRYRPASQVWALAVSLAACVAATLWGIRLMAPSAPTSAQRPP